MRLILFFLLIYQTNYSISQSTAPNNTIQDYIVSLTELIDLKHAPFSIFIKDLKSGQIIGDHNGDMSIPAASTMKLVTTASAYKILGSKYSFKTKIAYSGSIDSLTNTLNGNLYIIGGGDPTIGSKFFNKSDSKNQIFKIWADSIYNMGIHNINGAVIADGSHYNYQGVPAGWVWADMGNYYGAGPNGLTIYDNILELHFKTYEKGKKTNLFCTTPFIPNLYIRNTVKSSSSKRDNAYVFGAPYSSDWYVEGTLPSNKEDFIVKAANPDPEQTFAMVVDYYLNQKGIHTNYHYTTNRALIKDTSYATPILKELLVHKSPSLMKIINYTNQHSVNLFAEHLLCEIAVKRKRSGSTYNGALLAKAYWSKKINTKNLIMKDGSGLSRSNAVSSKFLVDLLNYLKDSQSFKKSLAIAGKKGTMSSIGRKTSAAGRVYGKSGTMSKMKAYAGYVDCKSGKKLAYSMIINNYNCTTGQVKKYFEQIMIKMANY